MKTETLFSSRSEEWETPPGLFAELNKKYHFTLDVAATDENALCERYYTREKDGLSQSWQTEGAVWCNPPYGRDIEKWMRKAYKESRRGQTIVTLIPARTDMQWFHKYVYPYAKLVFIKGRLHYGAGGVPSKNAAAFPSMIAIFNDKENDHAEH